MARQGLLRLSVSRLKAPLQTGASALLVLAMMVLGGLVLWIGVPLAWLWVGSKVQGATDSIGAALGAAAFGIIVSIALVLLALQWLNDRYRDLRLARGLDDLGPVVLEMVMAWSAGIALTGFTIWFLLFSGSSPIPINAP